MIDINKIQIYDQGTIGSCTSNSLAQSIRIKTENKVSISRIFNYFNSRLLEGNQYIDSGCSIVDCLKAICKYKWIDESLYPYDISMYNKFPPSNIYIEASKNTFNQYQTIQQSIYDVKFTLKEYLQPIIFGAMIYSSFEDIDKNGCVPTPNPSSDSFLGGHCLLAVGYNDNDKTILCVNSWGASWNPILKGCFKMHYDYFFNPNFVNDLFMISIYH